MKRAQQTARTAAEILLNEALRYWWEVSASGSERFRLLEQFGATHSRAKTNHFFTWRWDNLPPELRAFIVQHSLSGKPLEYLPNDPI